MGMFGTNALLVRKDVQEKPGACSVRTCTSKMFVRYEHNVCSVRTQCLFGTNTMYRNVLQSFHGRDSRHSARLIPKISWTTLAPCSYAHLQIVNNLSTRWNIFGRWSVYYFFERGREALSSMGHAGRWELGTSLSCPDSSNRGKDIERLAKEDSSSPCWQCAPSNREAATYG